MRITFIAVACAAASAVAAGIIGAAPAGAPQLTTPVFSTDVDLVLLHVAVRNRRGEFVPGLDKSNFKVFENGQQQTIRLLRHEDVPVAAGLIVDSSSSMSPKRPAVIAGAVEFARQSNPHDELFVLDFNERVYAGLPGGEKFTSSPSDLERAIVALPASGETALYDAITAGFERISGADRDTKVLLVISDGGDNASHVSRKQVLDRALRSNVLVYAIGIFDAEDPDRNPATLKRITRATGGESYFPQSLPEVESICAKIAVEIRNQYTIGYIPSNREMNGNYRTISVEATGPRGERLLVRTRSGYVARAGS